MKLSLYDFSLLLFILTCTTQSMHFHKPIICLPKQNNFFQKGHLANQYHSARLSKLFHKRQLADTNNGKNTLKNAQSEHEPYYTWRKQLEDEAFERGKKKQQEENTQKEIHAQNKKWGVRIGFIAAALLGCLGYDYLEKYLAEKYKNDVIDAIKNHDHATFFHLTQSPPFPQFIDQYGPILLKEAVFAENYSIAEKLFELLKIEMNTNESQNKLSQETAPSNSNFNNAWKNAHQTIEATKQQESLDKTLQRLLESPINWYEKRTQCIQLIRQGANIDVHIYDGLGDGGLYYYIKIKRLLDIAVQESDYAMVDFLLSKKTEKTHNYSVFYIQDIFMAKIFESHHVSFDVQSGEQTPLHACLERKLCSRDYIKFLADKVSHLDKNKNTPWHSLAKKCELYSEKGLFETSQTLQTIIPYQHLINAKDESAIYLAQRKSSTSCSMLVELLKQLSMTEKK